MCSTRLRIYSLIELQTIIGFIPVGVKNESSQEARYGYTCPVLKELTSTLMPV